MLKKLKKKKKTLVQTSIERKSATHTSVVVDKNNYNGIRDFFTWICRILGVDELFIAVFVVRIVPGTNGSKRQNENREKPLPERAPDRTTTCVATNKRLLLRSRSPAMCPSRRSAVTQKRVVRTRVTQLPYTYVWGRNDDVHACC